MLIVKDAEDRLTQISSLSARCGCGSDCADCSADCSCDSDTLLPEDCNQNE